MSEIISLRKTDKAEKKWPYLIVRKRRTLDNIVTYSLLCDLRRLPGAEFPINCICGCDDGESDKMAIQFVKVIAGENSEGYIMEKVVDGVKPRREGCNKCEIPSLYKH